MTPLPEIILALTPVVIVAWMALLGSAQGATAATRAENAARKAYFRWAQRGWDWRP